MALGSPLFRLLVPALLCTPCCLWAQLKMDSYPDHLDVLDRVYSRYRVERPGSTAELAKTPDGWWLQYEEGDSVTARYQIWSFEKRKYTNPDLPELARGEEPNAKPADQNNDWNASYYRACPYYGYRGWFLDVIKDYGDRKDLPAYAQYGLARAYSGAARGRLDDLLAEGPRDFSFLTDRGDKLTAEELGSYQALFNSACRTFSALSASTPSFDTHVGEVALKRDHEFMTGYMDLLMAGEPEAARRCVPADAYAPFYRNMARAYLASCDSNAILFTNGDTDTYPLWYVQVVEGYRRDVLVLNLSLLNAPRYPITMRGGHLGSLPADLRLSDAALSDRRTEYVLLSDGDDELLLPEVVDRLEAELRSPSSATDQPMTLPSRRFKLAMPAGTTITWEISKHYMLRSTVVVFDLLARYATTRPFHWAVTTGPDSYFGLTPHLALQGLTYKLVPDGPAPASVPDVPSRVLTQRSSQVLRDLCIASSNDTATHNRTRLVTNYVLQVTNTAEAMAAEGDSTGAFTLVQGCLAAFPNERWPFERVLIKPIELLWDLGRDAEADSLARILVHNLRTIPDRVSPVDGAKDEDDELRIRELVIERLRTMADKHDRKAFLEQLDRQPSSWPKPVVIKEYWPGASRPKDAVH